MEIKSIALNYGHTLSKTPGCGAVGIIDESVHTRKLGKRVKELLELNGVKVYDATIDKASTSSAYLQQAVKKANAQKVDLAVSIHFNCFSNSEANGTETLIYSSTSKAKDLAARVNNKLVGVGFRNRGVKVYDTLYWLKNTTAPAILIETCFVSNKKDVDLYNNKFENVAKAIVEGILNKTIKTTTASSSASTNSTSIIYRVYEEEVRLGSYGVVENTLNEVKKLIAKGVKNIRLERV